MSKRSYKIISTLYGLLSEHSEVDFIEASNHEGISKNLRTALQSLAEESDQIENGDTAVVSSEESNPKKKKNPNAKYKKRIQFSASDLSPEIGMLQYEKNLTNFLSDPKYFPSKAELQELLLKTSLIVEIEPRASRQRTARKIAIEGTKSDAFRVRLFEIIQDDASKQTQGWLDIISKS